MKITLDILDSLNLLDIVEDLLYRMAYKTPYYEAELEDGRKVPQSAKLVIPKEMFRAFFANLREEIKKTEERKNVKN